MAASVKKRRKVIFTGTGLGWFAVPMFFLGDADYRGKLFSMNAPPEMRLYLGLLAECGRMGEPKVTLPNKDVMILAKLDRNYLRTARKALEKARLIKAKRVSMSVYRYEIIRPDGRSLSDKTTDDWGIEPACN